MIIKGADILTPQGIIESGIIEIKDGIITRISPPECGSEGAGRTCGCVDEHSVIDATGLTVVPGFIDIHAHGGGGCDIEDGNFESLEKMCITHAAHGTTGILPATTSPPRGLLLEVAGLFRSYTGRPTSRGAEVLGIHLEGPWLNPKMKGAQPLSGIRRPSIDELDRLIDASSGNIRMVTLAPEMPGALDLIRHAKDSGLIVSLGHSSATYDQVLAAVDKGATHITHAYNAMSGLHHRNPGMVGAMLSCDRLTVDVILDGFHIHRAAAKILLKCKGKDNVALITDATMAAGMPEGEYELGGQKVIHKDGAVRLPDGTLAGSALTMDKAVRYLVLELGCSLSDAVKMASQTPARILGLDKKKGSVEVGKDADLVLLDKDLQVKATFVCGDPVYVQEGVLR